MSLRRHERSAGRRTLVATHGVLTEDEAVTCWLTTSVATAWWAAPAPSGQLPGRVELRRFGGEAAAPGPPAASRRVPAVDLV